MGLILRWTKSLGWVLVAIAGLYQPGGSAHRLRADVENHAVADGFTAAQRELLLQRARRYTVKVETPENQGSGVIIQSRMGVYSVVTNEHVVFEDRPITIQTHDGRTHLAKRVVQPNVLDLGVLTFKSGSASYPVAVLKPGLETFSGSPVLAAGFPNAFNGKSFRATEGQISHVTAKSLNGGYRIGYSNQISKGMSGGPVINAFGHVIAINGLHAEPLWGQPYAWDDGTTPATGLLPMFSGLSWAIPSETVMRSLPSSASGSSMLRPDVTKKPATEMS
ncbi:MAG: serine protease [Cyanobacteria bacterium P01_F01_bin.42]